MSTLANSNARTELSISTPQQYRDLIGIHVGNREILNPITIEFTDRHRFRDNMKMTDRPGQELIVPRPSESPIAVTQQD